MNREFSESSQGEAGAIGGEGDGEVEGGQVLGNCGASFSFCF